MAKYADRLRARLQKRPGQPQTVDEMRKQFNVPDDAVFDGFVVWLRERDEFLVKFHESAGVTQRFYGGTVEAALRFASHEEAEHHAKKSKYPAVVGLAFDIGNQVAIIGG